MHCIYYTNRLTATKVDSTYLGCLTSNTQRTLYVCGRARTHDHRVGSQRFILSRHTILTKESTPLTRYHTATLTPPPPSPSIIPTSLLLIASCRRRTTSSPTTPEQLNPFVHVTNRPTFKLS